MKKFYSIPEAAKVCSVDRSTMHRWVKAGNIKTYSTPGGHKRILPEDLRAWLEENGLPFDIQASEDKTTKILIVDDDPNTLNYLTAILKGVLIEVETASDGFEAGKKLIQFHPDLIILDLIMPNVNGFEVCEQIKSDPKTRHIKILILTGHGTDENREKAMAHGADEFLIKPSSKNSVLESVENLLKKNT